MLSSLRWKLALVVAIVAAVAIGFTYVTDSKTPGNHLGYGALIAAARDGSVSTVTQDGTHLKATVAGTTYEVEVASDSIDYFMMRSAQRNQAHRT